MRSPFLLQLREKFEILGKLWYNKMGNSCSSENFNALKFDGRAAGTVVKNLTMAGAAHSQLHRKFDTRENLTDVRA